MVSCMGRLAYLKRSLPEVLKTVDCGYCLVDYSCPDGCGAWARNEYPREQASGRLLVASQAGRRHFHKANALNVGARLAISAGARYLCFLDADTRPLSAFDAWLQRHIAPDRFLISLASPALFGFLVVPAGAFQQLDGFDEKIENYGGEDCEMRLRLYLRGGLAYVSAPAALLTVVPHADELRSQFYDVKDIRVSNATNLAYVRSKVREWTGGDVRQAQPNVLRLYSGARQDRVTRGPAFTSPYVAD